MMMTMNVMKQRSMDTNLCKEIIMPYGDLWLFEGHNKKHWPYQYTPPGIVSIRKMERWCWDNISHGRYWRNYHTYFAFKRKEDAALFMLSWS